MNNSSNNQFEGNNIGSPGDQTRSTLYGTTHTTNNSNNQDPWQRTYNHEPKKKKKKLGTTAIVLVVSFCLLGTSAIGGILAYNAFYGGGNDQYSLPSATPTNADLSMSVEEVTSIAAPSVVEIMTETENMAFFGQTVVTQEAGSGVIIDDAGYIVTNAHVVSGAMKVYVTLHDGTEYEAQVLGGTEDIDIAVLKIDADNLTAATLGNSDDINVGEDAIVIGNPLGTLGGTVSAGIVSSTNRELEIDENTVMNGVIQTDASVNPGNSGGGLFNDQGQLTGIIFAKSGGTDVEGLGFAIPINQVTEVVEQVINQSSEVVTF